MRTGLVNAYHAGSFIYVSHVSYVTLNAIKVVECDTPSRFVKPLVISPKLISNFKFWILLICVILIIIYYSYLQLPVVHFTFKNDFICQLVTYLTLLSTLVVSDPSYGFETYPSAVSIELYRGQSFTAVSTCHSSF